VLSKALATGLRPVVVINKMDRPEARPHEVLTEVFDLLVELGANDDTLDFPTVYTSARDGWATTDADQPPSTGDIHAVFEAIINHIPAPALDASAPLQALITTLDYNDYVGRIGIGRVFAGTLCSGQDITVIDRHGNHTKQRIGQLLRFVGLGRQAVDQIDVGDLFAVVGLEQVEIGDTLTDLLNPAALPTVPVDEPTLHMTFRINDGPFTGREGTYVTSRQIRDRLWRELQLNVALRVEEQEDGFIVSGRGLLHLGILLENMRREGYELLVGKPEVIYHYDADTRLEPIERLVIDVPTEHVGAAMQLVGERRGEVSKMDTHDTRTHLEFTIPARGLIGLRSRLLTATQGEAVMHHRFHTYDLFRGQISQRANGVMIATETGQVTAYALDQLADRGIMFVAPGEAVYEGQVVGEHCKEGDIPVNVVRRKALTNVRSSTKEATVMLKVPRKLTLEAALEYIEHDELVELTPQSIRLRKRWLREADRRRLSRRLAATLP
jgi:GTP-binding protein